MDEELKEQFDAVLDLAIGAIPKFAKIYRKLYTALITEGFSKEQATEIVINHRIGGK